MKVTRKYFHIFALHPREMQQTERDEFKHIVSSVNEMYGIDNLVEEALAWYEVQKHKPLDDNSLVMIELVKQTTLFPAVRKAILIALTLPATSCTVERSFSTLRRLIHNHQLTVNIVQLTSGPLSPFLENICFNI